MLRFKMTAVKSTLVKLKIHKKNSKRAQKAIVNVYPSVHNYYRYMHVHIPLDMQPQFR